MLTKAGKNYLLNLQLADLANSQFGLFTAPAAVDENTLLTDLTEAAWTSYARAGTGPLSGPVSVGERAITTPDISVGFGNGSGSDQTFAGWFLVAADSVTLLAVALVDGGVVPNGLTYILAAQFSDRGE